jgi:rhodanese-related sulfurtransferase
MLDTRTPADYALGHIPQSINIGIKGDFAPWVGAVLGDVKQQLMLITDEGAEEEVVTRLARVGFDQVLGYLKGGISAWKDAGKQTDTVKRITASQFEHEFKPNESMVIDVRRETEYAASHVDEAYSKPLAYINEWVGNIDPKKHFYLHCAGGYRSMIAASILKARGFHHFSEIDGGFNAINKTSVPKTDFICQSKVMST